MSGVFLWFVIRVDLPLQVNLNAGYEKLDAELTRLRSQLEAEKSRFKSMQSDLQKELNVAFDENTKLTTLLDGNVPKSTSLTSEVFSACVQVCS